MRRPISDWIDGNALFRDSDLFSGGRRDSEASEERQYLSVMLDRVNAFLEKLRHPNLYSMAIQRAVFFSFETLSCQQSLL